MTDRQTTHAQGCWSWGPAHYECAVGKIDRMRAENERLRAERDALAAALEAAQMGLRREESDHERTIDQRDAAEDALSRMFQAVTGRPAEWSSAWGYVDAIEEVEEHVAALAAMAARGEDDAWCAECGVKLENVRPGKHQHPTCSQAQPLTDEALLRQALEALEFEAGGWEYPPPKTTAAIAALRERLGEKEQR